jgi:hypothetical protein
MIMSPDMTMPSGNTDNTEIFETVVNIIRRSEKDKVHMSSFLGLSHSLKSSFKQKRPISGQHEMAIAS